NTSYSAAPPSTNRLAQAARGRLLPPPTTHYPTWSQGLQCETGAPASQCSTADPAVRTDPSSGFVPHLQDFINTDTLNSLSPSPHSYFFRLPVPRTITNPSFNRTRVSRCRSSPLHHRRHPPRLSFHP